MGFLWLLANSEPAMVSDGIFKYVAGGMGVGMGALAYFIKVLYADVKEIPDKIAKAEGVVRDKYTKVIEDLEKKNKEALDAKEREITEREVELKELRTAKEKMILDQVEDLKRENISFSKISVELKKTLDESVAPVLGRNNELLEYYKKKRESGK